jgi:hypothetical protein
MYDYEQFRYENVKIILDIQIFYQICIISYLIDSNFRYHFQIILLSKLKIKLDSIFPYLPFIRTYLNLYYL